MRNINLVDIDLNRDIQEITSYIQSYIDSTYLSQIRNQIKTHKRESAQVPFPEVQLLNAMIPFVREDAKDKLSKIIEMITYSKMIENMLPNYGVEGANARSMGQEKGPKDYLHQAVVVLVLYKAIIWAEETDKA